MNFESIVETLETLTSDELILLKSEIESLMAIRDFTEDYYDNSDSYDDEEYDDDDEDY